MENKFNFHNLSNFITLPPFLRNEHEAINYLNRLLDRNHLNDCNYDEINYEYLIVIRKLFLQDECCRNQQLLNLLNEVEEHVCEQFILKQQFLKRLM